MDELRDYIRAQLQKSPVQGTPQQLEEAVEALARSPGSPERQAFYRMKAQQGMQEKRESQVRAGSFGDVAERTGRDVGVGLARGVSSPLRLGMHIGDKLSGNHLGQQFEDYLSSFSPEATMGGRGLSSNPVLGSLQSAIEPAANMAGGMPLAGGLQREAGNILTNMGVRNAANASRLGTAPSKVLSALSRAKTVGPMQAGAGAQLGEFASNLPRAMTTGAAAAYGSMPDETFGHGDVGKNLLFGAGLGAMEAGRGVSPMRPETINAPSRLGRLRANLQTLTEAPDEPQYRSQAEALPEDIPEIAPVASAAAPAAPAAATPAAAPAAPVPSPASPLQPPGIKGPAKAFDPPQIDFTTLDPETQAKVQTAWDAAKDVSSRAKLLGVEDRVLGANGGRLEPRYVKNVTEAQSPNDLHGFLQKQLLRAVGGAGKAAKVAAPGAPSGAEAPVEAAAPVAAAGVKPPKIKIGGPPPDAGGPLGVPPAAAAPAAPGVAPKLEVLQGGKSRTGKLPRQDVLRTAPRMEDGTLDWDKLSPEQRAPVLNMLGKDYRGKVATMKLESIQKMLNTGQFESFIRALKKQPKTPEGPVPSAETGAPESATASSPDEVVETVPAPTGAPKLASTIVPDKPGVEPPLTEATPADVAAAQPDIHFATRWDGLEPSRKASILGELTGSTTAAERMRKQPFEQLPGALRELLLKRPDLFGGKTPEAPAPSAGPAPDVTTAAPVAQEAGSEPKPFPKGKRRPKPKSPTP